MFAKYGNIAIASFNLVVDGPVLVQSGKSNKIDPTLPDSSFVRGIYEGKMTLVIPGSTIKGVIRSRVHDINSSIVDGLFGKAGDKPQKGKVGFHDAYAIPESVVTNIRYNTKIDNKFQSAATGTLRTLEVAEQGVFDAGFRLINYEEAELKLILKALSDVDTGLVRFGGGKSRGFGMMKVKNFHINISEGFDKNLRVKNEKSFSTLDFALNSLKG